MKSKGKPAKKRNYLKRYPEEVIMANDLSFLLVENMIIRILLPT